MQMIDTLLSSPEHSHAFKTAGIYGHILHYAQQVKAGYNPPKLPGEGGQAMQAQGQPMQVQGQPMQAQGQPMAVTIHKNSLQSSQKGNEKALNYFSACLRILDLEEEVALTNDALKAAYKKAVVRAHPDKGGSEKEFEAVTRAYAYLGDILSRIRGGRKVEGKVEAPTALSNGRGVEAEAWKMV